MRIPRIAIAVLAMSVLISSTACMAATTHESSDALDTAAAIKTTAAETTDITTVSTVTSIKPTRTPSETTMPEPTPNPDVLVIHTDWNGDGVEDTFRREYIEGDYKNGVLIYTDGVTGKMTDVTSCCGLDYFNKIRTFTDDAYLYEDATGNRVILDTLDMGWGYYTTHSYTYDPATILAYTDIDGDFSIEGDKLYLTRRSFIFGSCELMLVPASVSMNQLTAQDIGTEVWWISNLEAASDPTVLPPYSKITLQDFAAEKISGDTVEPVTILEGTNIYPLYSTMDESGAGYLYFRTVDDGDCRASFTAPKERNPVLFNGINQGDIFVLDWGD